MSGTGYVDIPYVQISGGGGFGATALAIIDASGNLTGIKMTNPGVDYTSAPTFTLLGGGPNATGSITGNATLAPNVTTAGLIKNGTGTLSLNGNNTYTGGTTVNGGTIAFNTPTALGSGALVINAAGAGIDDTDGVAGGGTKPIPGLVFVSNTPETWNADLVYGGTRNMTIGGPISLGTSAGATRTLTTNAAPGGFSASALTISGVISNGTNGTTPTTGFTKAGAGNLIITGVQAYTGATNVTAGTLQVDKTGSLNASSGITINGAAAKFLDTGTVPVSAPVTVTLGTLDGTGTVNSASVANAAGAIVTHGNSTTAPLTVGSLTFNGAATMNLITSPATAATAKIATTNLTTNAAGKVTINATNTAGFWDSGSFSAVTYTGAIGGAGFSAFQLPVSPATLTGLGGRQTATLDNATPGLVKIVVGGDRAAMDRHGGQQLGYDHACVEKLQALHRRDCHRFCSQRRGAIRRYGQRHNGEPHRKRRSGEYRFRQFDEELHRAGQRRLWHYQRIGHQERHRFVDDQQCQLLHRRDHTQFRHAEH